MKAKLIFHVFILALVSITFFSCDNDDGCTSGDCGENGFCDQGICNCISGYEGLECEIEEREKFLGFWKPTDYECDILSDSKFNITIEKSTLVKNVSIKLETGSDLPLTGTLVGNTINIPQHNFGTTYFGSIVLIGGEIKLNLLISKNSDVQVCSLTAIKE